MARDRKPTRPAEEGAGFGWTALSYLISGMVVWGLIGWAVDTWLDLNNVTASKQSVTGATGLVLLASNDVTKRYWHADLTLG